MVYSGRILKGLDFQNGIHEGHSNLDEFVSIRFGNVVSCDRISMRFTFLIVLIIIVFIPGMLYVVVSEVESGVFYLAIYRIHEARVFHMRA